MKIVFFTRGFPSENDIMAGNYEAVQAKALAAKGCQVSVVTNRELSRHHLLDIGRIRHRKVDGVDVYEGTSLSFSKRFIRRINRYTRRWSYSRLFKRCISEHGMPDVLHGHIVSTSSFTIFLKEKYHLPYIITEHWSKTFVSESPKWLRQMTSAYYKADKVICVSQALAYALKQNFSVRSIVINNMVNDKFFQSVKKTRNDKLFRLLACGAFRKDRNKGFDILVDAVAKAQFPGNVHLDIVGDGEDRPFVEDKIAEYGLSGQIHLLGVKTPDEVSDLLCRSDCFVLSSRLETFAIVVIEAMAKGLPVIATRCGGPETFLQPEHGLLVEKENVAALADAMKYMTTHAGDYDPAAIRQFCHDHFSQDVIASQIIDVYKQVLSCNIIE